MPVFGQCVVHELTGCLVDYFRRPATSSVDFFARGLGTL